jgi:hypothetical protein
MSMEQEVKRTALNLLRKEGATADKVWRELKMEYPDMGMRQLAAWLDDITDNTTTGE